jgi:hypothetical protein
MGRKKKRDEEEVREEERARKKQRTQPGGHLPFCRADGFFAEKYANKHGDADQDDYQPNEEMEADGAESPPSTLRDCISSTCLAPLARTMFAPF